MSSLDALLARLYAQNEFVIKYDLDAMRAALSALGFARLARCVVLVGGTNGKGTTSAALNAMGMAAGFSVGLFTSPHLVDFRERMRVNGAPISVADVLERLPPLIDRFGGPDHFEGPRPLSFFELTTLLAFDWFNARGPLDLAVIEVGMGGRLDATNALDPDASVVTSVSLDHMAWLGDTVEAIAREKAPIARAGRPVWIHRASGGFEAISAALAPLRADVRVVEGGTDARAFNFALAEHAARFAFERLGVPSDRAARAIASAERSARWPARQQTLRHRDQTWLIDGAHNPASMAQHARWLDTLAADGIVPEVAIVAASPGRDLDTTFGAVPRWPQRIVCAPATVGRSLDPIELSRFFAARAAGHTVEVVASGVDAVAAVEEARTVVVVGSLYLCGGVLAALGATAESLAVYEPG